MDPLTKTWNPAPFPAILLNPEPANGDRAGALVPLVVECGLSHLCFSAGTAAILPDPADPGSTLLLEPVRFAGHTRLLLLNTAGATVRVNDRVAPSAVLLREKDRLTVGGAPALEVGVCDEPRVGAPSPANIGQRCPVCLHPFLEGSRAYHCPCGTVIHLEEGEEGPEAEARKCALAVTCCPSCTRPIRLDQAAPEAWTDL